jgi:hypothetical protein
MTTLASTSFGFTFQLHHVLIYKVISLYMDGSEMRKEGIEDGKGLQPMC